MKRSLIRSVFVAALALASAVFGHAVKLCRDVVSWFVPRAAIAKIQRDDAAVAASQALSAASAFVKRIVKRERPRIEARWAMCPSI